MSENEFAYFSFSLYERHKLEEKYAKSLRTLKFLAVGGTTPDCGGGRRLTCRPTIGLSCGGRRQADGADPVDVLHGRPLRRAPVSAAGPRDQARLVRSLLSRLRRLRRQRSTLLGNGVYFYRRYATLA